MPDARRRARAGRTAGRGLLGRRAFLLLAVAVLLLCAAGALSAVLTGGGNAGLSPPQVTKVRVPVPGGEPMATVPSSVSSLMGLRALQRPAPTFTLTDQSARAVSLRGLDRSHAVVLWFMDDRCADTCPVVEDEVAHAFRDLGAQARNVAFVAVNVDAARGSVATVHRFVVGRGRALGALPDFSYLTGTASSLAQVWRAYGVDVKVTGSSGDVYHADAMYFVAPGGTEVFQATPYANLRENGTGWLPASTMDRWAQGIAHYAAVAARR